MEIPTREGLKKLIQAMPEPEYFQFLSRLVSALIRQCDLTVNIYCEGDLIGRYGNQAVGNRWLHFIGFPEIQIEYGELLKKLFRKQQ
ncbi:MAG: hypothetical protein KTR14_10090 [Vampirovibrio sp.]|nr:hypothetical protein [Vampirovibrio sp.]